YLITYGLLKLRQSGRMHKGKKSKMDGLTISKMDVSDIDQVMQVEIASQSAPWPEDIFYQEIIENSHAHYFKLMLENQIIGYAGAWIVLDDAQITNIAISPRFRGQKLGEKLFQY